MAARKYHKGEVLTLIFLNESVTVMHNTLKGGAVNEDEATVFVETKDGVPVAIPVAIQDRYLTTAPPKATPITGNNITSKPGLLQRIFGPAQKELKK